MAGFGGFHRIHATARGWHWRGGGSGAWSGAAAVWVMEFPGEGGGGLSEGAARPSRAVAYVVNAYRLTRFPVERPKVLAKLQEEVRMSRLDLARSASGPPWKAWKTPPVGGREPGRRPPSCRSGSPNWKPSARSLLARIAELEDEIARAVRPDRGSGRPAGRRHRRNPRRAGALARIADAAGQCHGQRPRLYHRLR